MRFFKKKTPPTPSTTTDTPPQQPSRVTRLGPSFQLKGQISGTDDVVFAGKLEGNIQIQAHLTLPDSADITGDLSARTMDLAGNAEGKLAAETTIVIRQSAHIKGRITVPALTLQAGATFDGKISMGGTAESRSFDVKRSGEHGK